jgi:hypothetical protein
MLKRREFLALSRNRPAPPETYWQHVSRPSMACRFEVTLPLEDQAGVSAARLALDEVDKLERRLTIFREDSDLSFINRLAAENSVQVEDALFSLLVLCKELCRETGGAFDITSGPLTRCWGFLKRHGRIPAPDELDDARACVGGDKLILSAGFRYRGDGRIGSFAAPDRRRAKRGPSGHSRRCGRQCWRRSWRWPGDDWNHGRRSRR